MGASAKRSELQDYHQQLGALLDSLLRLETAMREYLVLTTAETAADSRTFSSLAYGKKVAVDAFTTDDSFGELVRQYNETFTTKSSVRKYAIDVSIVSTRNTLAHGRIMSNAQGEPPALVNFTACKGKEKFVKVEYVVNNTTEWCRAKLPEVVRHLSRVKAAIEARRV